MFMITHMKIPGNQILLEMIHTTIKKCILFWSLIVIDSIISKISPNCSHHSQTTAYSWAQHLLWYDKDINGQKYRDAIYNCIQLPELFRILLTTIWPNHSFSEFSIYQHIPLLSLTTCMLVF